MTKSAAEKHFGINRAVGQSLTLNNTDTFIVTGVIDDMPKNSFLRDHHIFMSMAGWDEAKDQEWGSHDFPTFIKLLPNADIKDVKAPLDEMFSKYLIPYAQETFPGLTEEAFLAAGNYLRYSTIPITDIHLHSNRAVEFSANGDIQNVYILSFLALFLIVLAGVNFMNLSTAYSLKRAKEVGVRKTLGSGKIELIRQFLSESGLITFISLVLAVMVARIALPFFNELSGKAIEIPFDLGYSKDKVLIIEDVHAAGSKAQAFKYETQQMAQVSSATLTGYLPTPSYRRDNSFFLEGALEQENAIQMQNWMVDYDYINTLDLELVAGRNFDETILILLWTNHLIPPMKLNSSLGHIFITFTILSIFLACLGLFGLAAFNAEKRRKEIGIRKVLGATVSQLSYRLTVDFLKLVGVGILISLPIGWYVMNKWLEDFSYRIEIGFEVLVFAALLAVAVAVITNKGIFTINIVGLALGIGSCLIIMLFVVDELSYDQYNENADEIVNVVFRAKINGEEIKEGAVMAPVGKTLKQEFPEVLDATRIRNIGMPKIIIENESYREDRFAFVDANFFNVFTLPIIDGNTINPLQEPNTAVITKVQAEKFFGATNAIGELFYLEGEEQPYRVTGVIEKMPQNSHFHFDIFASMEGLEQAKSDSWFNGDFFTYLLLEKGSDYKYLETKLPYILEKYMGPMMQEEIGAPFEEFTKENQLGFRFLQLTDMHLRSDNSPYSQLEQGGDIKYVYIFSAVALFMLLIACINFMNLSTATAAKRAKEVGIRKVLGSNKGQLRYQFLSESFIATLIAMVFATILVFGLLPFYNDLSGKELQLDFLRQPFVILVLTLLTLLISLLAGGYPAFFLSSFKPIAALKNKFLGGNNNKGVRSGLVVFQFVVSAGLILATLVVNQQMQYIQNKDIGYDRDQLLVLREAYFLGNQKDAFKNDLLKNPKTMGMELISGRNFSTKFGADSTNVIINQTAAKVLGFGNNAIGKTVTDGGGDHKDSRCYQRFSF
ncbi:putative ABC transporter permease YknZ [Nymphon striatum]|nr:putative ABC transporter permease YknZ [Nymphon striatum]